MSVLDTLRAARELISDESRWTQGAYARNAVGEPTVAIDTSACCWCAIGACRKVTGAKLCFGWWEELETGACGSITTVNDTLGHAAVLRVFDSAIARLESAEA